MPAKGGFRAHFKSLKTENALGLTLKALKLKTRFLVA